MSWATVSARGAKRWAAGHPWIFRSDVEASPSTPGITSVRDTRGKFLGQALCSPRSEMSACASSNGASFPITPAWWHERIAACRERRRRDANAWRAVHAEGDGLPALVVDRYDRWLVVQLLSAALETERGAILDALRTVYQPAGDPAAARCPGAQASRGSTRRSPSRGAASPSRSRCARAACAGLPPRGPAEDRRPLRDQRDNRILAAGRRSPTGATALDCFAYHGLFSTLTPAARWAATALDASQDVLHPRRRQCGAQPGHQHRLGSAATPSTCSPIGACRPALRRRGGRPAGVREEQGAPRRRAARLPP